MVLNLKGSFSYKTCEEMVNDALVRSKELGNSVLNDLAALMEKLGQLEASLKIRRSLVEHTKPADGEEASGEHAKWLNNLALLLWRLGRHSDAVPYQKDAVRIKRLRQDADLAEYQEELEGLEAGKKYPYNA